MIISASRRTDVPAFYSEWFMNRVREGFCTVPNPFNRHQVSTVSLRPEDVDVFVFWTRNPRPLFPYLGELEELGYRYYFNYTLLDNPRPIDPKSPPADAAIKTFVELADRVGACRVTWRYDPIVLSEITPPEFHCGAYARIAAALAGSTARSVVSLVDVYRKAQKRLDQLRQVGVTVADLPRGPVPAPVGAMLAQMVRTAGAHGMEIFSCAEEVDLSPYGIQAGKCIDDEYIACTFGLRLESKKDPHQRAACGCVVSKDIGMYDSCLFGCTYCYATGSFELARRNHAEHDPQLPSIVGRR